MPARTRLRPTAPLVLVLAFLALFARPAAAQFDSAQMSGFVKDAQGQMVPGASVRIQNQATQLERNYATGLWLDISVDNALVTHNLVRRNGGIGIFFESQFARLMHRNYTKRNNATR